MKEQREESAYKAIPLKTRIIVRSIVFLLRLLQPMLEKEKMSAYFAIESYADEIEDRLEEAESKPTIQ